MSRSWRELGCHQRKGIAGHKDNLEDEDDLIKEDYQKNKNYIKNEEKFKNDNNVKKKNLKIEYHFNEDYIKNEDDLRIRMTWWNVTRKMTTMAVYGRAGSQNL